MTSQLYAGFQNSNVLRMFPTWLWKAELRPDVFEPLNEQILQSLFEIEAALADLTPGKSWQSDQGLHKLETFQGLVARFDEAVKIVFDYLKIGHRDFKITGCWASVNGANTGHRIHSHPNNFISGVYYVRTSAGADTINFHDPRPQRGIICPPVTELTADNTDQVVVTVRDGTILMFPAWLQHSVAPNRGDCLRVSISFNIMLASFAETVSKPWWEPGWRQSRS